MEGNMEDKNIATRPMAIIEAKFDLDSKQNDIIDMLLTEISDDGKLVYELNIEKYKKIYTSDTSNIYRDMKKAVKNFEKKGFHAIIDGTETWFTWFTKIAYYDGEGRVTLKMDSELKDLLTEVKQRICYDIGNTLNCVSKYSKRLYYYLKLYEDTGWRIDTIENLHSKMKCPDSYMKNYGKFKEKVLNVALQEINNITDIQFDYEEIKEGRRVVRLKFNIKNKNVIPKIIEVKNPEMSVEVNELLKDLLTREDVVKVENVLEQYFNNKTKSKTSNKIDFLKEKIEYLETYPKTNEEGSSYIALLLSALKGDWVKLDRKITKPQKKFGNEKVKQLGFHNFTGRQYTKEEDEELERKLLGWD